MLAGSYALTAFRNHLSATSASLLAFTNTPDPASSAPTPTRVEYYQQEK